MTTAIEADDAAALVRPSHRSSRPAPRSARCASPPWRASWRWPGAGTLEPSARDTLEVAGAEWEAAADAIGAWLERASAE